MEGRRPLFPVVGPHCVRVSPICTDPYGPTPPPALLADHLLVALCWLNQPWFLLLLQLLRDLLTQQSGSLPHPDLMLLRLAAWPLSGLSSKQQAFHRRLRALPRQPNVPSRLRIASRSVLGVGRWTHSQTLRNVRAGSSKFFLCPVPGRETVSTIRNYNSSVVVVHHGFPDGATVGTRAALHQLLQGMFHQCHLAVNPSFWWW